MIIFTKELIENDEQLNDIIEKEKILINSALANQEKLKSILLVYMQKFVDTAENIDSDYSSNLLTILNDFKNSLNLFRTNIDLFNRLLKLLDKMYENKDITTEIINNFNISFFTDSQSIAQNTLKIEDVLHSVLPYSNLIFSKIDTLRPNTNIDANISIQSPPLINNTMKDETKKEITQVSLTSNKKNDNVFTNIDTSNLIENTLIISETKGKIFLPYTIKLLKNILKNNPGKYTSIEDIIRKEYTLPIDLFKNSTLARFREGFKLIRKKEKRSIIEAFDLGMELTFNYNLHPAIICACKSLSELDLYLDYLDNRENGEFECFKIIFDVPPISV